MQLPYTKIQDYTGEPVEGDDVMEFRLLYSGRLLGAKKNETRADHKHALRREFHPQLRQLWQSSKSLDEYARHYTVPWFSKNPGVNADAWTNEQFRQVGIESIGDQWERNGFKFVPLVTELLCLRCSVEILFLRPQAQHYIMQSGDLDARVKTIFDALRIPKNLSETGGMGPQEDETPFFCLLEDDKLISQVSVTCDELLVLPKERQVNSNDAFLIVHVRLKPTPLTQWGALFE